MDPTTRKFFRFLNKFFMVPIFRSGFGGLMVNPFSGYIMVMKIKGRKSGKLRYAPVNYAIHEGSVYCISGGRLTSDWYKNLLASPEIEVILPGGAIFGKVTEEMDPETRRIVIRKVLRNAGFAGFFEGYNPWKISDEELASKTTDLPLIKISPRGIGNGASDPQGWAWVTLLTLTLLLILVIILLVK